MAQKRRFIAACCGGIFLAFCCAGCLPNDMPAYIDGGKTIVIWADEMIWAYNVRDKTVTPYPSPENCHLEYAKMLGDQVWVMFSEPSGTACRRFDITAPASQPADKIASLIADLDSDDWNVREKASELLAELPPSQITPLNKALDKSPSPEKQLRLRNAISKIKSHPFKTVTLNLRKNDEWLRNVAMASYDGKKCVFLFEERESSEKRDYEVFSLPDLKKQATVNLDTVISAGRFWWINLAIKKDQIEHVDLYNPEGKKVSAISAEEGQKMRYTRSRGPVGYARLSDDDKTLLLSSGELSYITFGLFDVKSGKFLWGGKTENGLRGNPLVKNKEIWYLEQSDDAHDILLVRYTEGEKEIENNKDVILKYPVPSDLDLHSSQFTVSPDGSHFVMSAEGRPPLLLLIPIRKDVTEKDVTAVKLQTSTAPASTPAK